MTGWDMGGGGGKSATFNNVGDTVQGTVLDMTEVQQTDFQTGKPKHWDNGDPMMQFRITLQTDQRDPTEPTDDGKRELYVKGGKKPRDDGGKSSQCAVLDAIREATGGTQLQYGAWLGVQYVGNGHATQGTPPKNYIASYRPPAMDMAQPAEHRAAPQPAAQPAFGSPADNGNQPAPAWAQPALQQQPQLAQPVNQQPAQQQPLWGQQGGQQQGAGQVTPAGVAAANPFASQPQQAAQQAPQEQLGHHPQQPAQQGLTAAVGNVGQPPNATAVAALTAAGIDPATVYGPGWEQQVQLA